VHRLDVIWLALVAVQAFLDEDADQHGGGHVSGSGDAPEALIGVMRQLADERRGECAALATEMFSMIIGWSALPAGLCRAL